jgi:putative membrane protein
MAMADASDTDVTRRTHLAAERTWLAWWRSGIACATAAVAVGGVVPDLIDESHTPYVILGAGYAAVAVGMFVAGGVRQRKVQEALERAEFADLSSGWIAVFSVVGAILALGTFAAIVA